MRRERHMKLNSFQPLTLSLVQCVRISRLLPRLLRLCFCSTFFSVFSGSFRMTSRAQMFYRRRVAWPFAKQPNDWRLCLAVGWFYCLNHAFNFYYVLCPQNNINRRIDGRICDSKLAQLEPNHILDQRPFGTETIDRRISCKLIFLFDWLNGHIVNESLIRDINLDASTATNNQSLKSNQ